MSDEYSSNKRSESDSETRTASSPTTQTSSLTRRGLLAIGSASMVGLAGCSMFGGGGSDNSSANNTTTATSVPDAVGDGLFSSVTLEQGALSVEMSDSAESAANRLSLIGPVNGGGDTAEETIYPGIEEPSGSIGNAGSTDSSDAANGNQSSRPVLQPNEIPRRPVFRSIQLSDNTTATFTLLQQEFGPEAQNYKSGIYYLVALGSDGVVAQRRISLVPILTLLSASLGDNGGLLLTLKNTGTGPSYPAYATVIGAMGRNRGEATRLSGGNGITADNFVLGPTQERQFSITPRSESRVDAPFSYPRTNSTGGAEEQDFDVESSAYCTGTGTYSHGLAVILGLVSGGYVGLRLSATLGGQPELVEAEPNDEVLCGSLSVRSSLPRQFIPVRWPGGRDVLLETPNGTGQNGTGTFGNITTTGTGNSTAETTDIPPTLTPTRTTQANASNGSTANDTTGAGNNTNSSTSSGANQTDR